MTRETLIRTLQKAAHVLPAALFAAALYIVHTQLQAHDLRHILASLHALPMRTVGAAVALTVLNYLVLAGYDWLALRFTGYGQVPLPKMIAAAMLGYAISNNTGHAWAAGGSIRYRFYSKWGVLGWDILKISLFQTVSYLLGALSLGLVGGLLLPHYLARATEEPPAIHWVTLICSAALLAYWSAVLLWCKPLKIKDFELYLPSPAMTLAQTLVSSVDIVLSSLVLWVLLDKADMGFGAFVVMFIVAQVVGVISQVPGGIGVFESAFLWLTSAIATSSQHWALAGALLLYRAIYYFLPLLLAGIGLLGYEIASRRALIAERGAAARQLLAGFVPPLYALLLLLAGGILLFSGALPANTATMAWLRELAPLPMIELSHLAGSLIGLLLLFLARGIWLKIDAAWYGGLLLLGLGIIASLLKGFDWREALVLSVILLLLLPAHDHFRRQSSLLRMPLSTPWRATIAMVLTGAVWLGFFAYRDVAYAHDLWWQFSYDGNAPRFLRALLLIAVVMVGCGLLRLLSIAPPRVLAKPSARELDEAQRLAVQGDQTQGFLALLGDKYLLWSPQRDAFIMFTTTPQFWIAMGDPVGAPAAYENLLWQFLEQADRYGAKAVLYQVSQESLPYCLDLGLSLFKFGEEARVELPAFTLQGKQRDAFRSARNKFGKLGYRFAILSGNDVDAALPLLRQISDAWLAHKNTREKGFSLGFFDAAYLRHTDIAVIKNESGHIKAFANLWRTANRKELSIDLMRYHPDSPKGIMDFLFAELLLWGKAENYQWFSLGMAPLAGLERRPLAPLWHKMGAAIFDMGDQFYNFEGLYEYKAKFSPHWRPRYLAAPAGLTMPLALMAIARQIAGGWHGIIGK